MSKTSATPEDVALDSSGKPPTPKRINVAINADMLAAIDRVIEREQVSLTEAVRRLITYGDFVYRAVKEENAAVVLRAEGRPDREVVLV